MRKKFLSPIILAGIAAIATACSTAEPTSPEPPALSTTATMTTPEETPEFFDPGEETSISTIGGESGMDCVAYEDCSVLFTIESVELLDSCPDPLSRRAPDNTNLIKITTLIKTKPSSFEYDPSGFTVWSDWSTVDNDGVHVTLPKSSWCDPAEGEESWTGKIHVGDTVRRVHITDFPTSATTLKLTETRTDSRWAYDISDVLTPTETLATTPQPEAPIQTSAAVASQEAYTPPAAAPVMGFTGAPGVDPIRPLNKTISHCGDSLSYETGTTFFTDGTTGWTETCSQQMLQ